MLDYWKQTSKGPIQSRITPERRVNVLLCAAEIQQTTESQLQQTDDCDFLLSHPLLVASNIDGPYIITPGNI